jgi:GMP synthase-like glutamine amidotransferase
MLLILIYQIKLPLLAVCYGAQYLLILVVVSSSINTREYGRANLSFIKRKFSLKG